MSSQARAYYESLKERFTLNLEESPTPGQVLFNKETNVYWGVDTCREHNIDFELFKQGELEARAEAQASKSGSVSKDAE